MVGWHHRFNNHDFEQTLGEGEGQGGLGCYSPRSIKESDMTERLNRNVACEVEVLCVKVKSQAL